MRVRNFRSTGGLVRLIGVCVVAGAFMAAPADAEVYKFTNPGGTDLVHLATEATSFQTNYASTSEAVAAFKHGQNAIVWTVDEELSMPGVVLDLGGFVHRLDSSDSLTYTLDGPYQSLLEGYTSNLNISLADSNGRGPGSSDGAGTGTYLRFTDSNNNYSSVGSSALVTSVAPTTGQTITLTFSENVEAFGITWDTAREFDITIYDAASGGNVIGTLSMAGTKSPANTVWSASQAGVTGGIGRVELYRADQSNDARILQIGFVPMPVPEPAGLALMLGGALLGLRRRRA